MLHATMESVLCWLPMIIGQVLCFFEILRRVFVIALELVGPSVVHFASGCYVQPNRELMGHQFTEQHVIRCRAIRCHRHSHMWECCPLIHLLGTCSVVCGRLQRKSHWNVDWWIKLLILFEFLGEVCIWLMTLI